MVKFLARRITVIKITEGKDVMDFFWKVLAQVQAEERGEKAPMNDGEFMAKIGHLAPGILKRLM